MPNSVKNNWDGGGYIVVECQRSIDGADEWFEVAIDVNKLINTYAAKCIKSKGQRVREANGCILIDRTT